jgi:hypothetical protein
MNEQDPQTQLDSVFDACKEQQADDVLPVLKDALASAGFATLDRHVVYSWAEDISAGVRPQA